MIEIITIIEKHNDKIFHFTFNFGLVFVFGMLGYIFNNSLLGVVLGIFSAVSLSSLKELHDRMFKGQSIEASRKDLVADFVGIIVGLTLYICIII